MVSHRGAQIPWLLGAGRGGAHARPYQLPRAGEAAPWRQ